MSRLGIIVYKILLFLSLFTYFYPEQYVFLPCSTVRVLQIIGAGLCILNFRRIYNSSISIVFKTGILYFFVGFCATAIFNNAFDYTFALKGVYFFLYFCSSFVIVSLLNKIYKSHSLNHLCNWMLFITLIQAIISFVFFLNPGVFSSYQNIIIQSEFNEMASEKFSVFRLIGVGGLRYASAAVHYGLMVLIAFYLFFSEKTWLSSHPFIFYIIVVVFSVAGVLSGRTFFIMLPLFIVYIYLITNKSILGTMKRAFYSFVPIIALFAVFIVYVFAENEEMMKWAFELFINLSENGSLETSSTNVMKEMFVFPDNLYTWVFGDGKAMDGNGFYKSTDLGYIRSIFYWGLLGTLLYYTYQVRLARGLIKISPSYEFSSLIKIIIIWFFIYNLKDFWQMENIIILFMSVIVFKNKKNEDFNRNTSI